MSALVVMSSRSVLVCTSLTILVAVAGSGVEEIGGTTRQPGMARSWRTAAAAAAKASDTADLPPNHEQATKELARADDLLQAPILDRS